MNDNHNDDDDFVRLILANKREWNGFWFWRNKPAGERGAARDILEAAKVQVTDLRSLDQDPPIAKQCWTANCPVSE